MYALTGQTATSLNLCAAAASMYTQHLLVRRIVESGRLPQVIYLEVTPDGTVSMTENWLASGLTALGDVRDLRAASSMNGSLLRTGLFAAVFSSHRQWGDLRLIAKSEMLGAPLQPRSKLHFDQRGWARWSGEDDDRIPDEHATAVIADGRRPRFSTFTKHCKNPNAQGLRRAIAMFREAGVTVRLLEIPLRSTASPRRHPDKNPAYRGFLKRMVFDLAVPVVQPPRGLSEFLQRRVRPLLNQAAQPLHLAVVQRSLATRVPRQRSKRVRFPPPLQQLANPTITDSESFRDLFTCALTGITRCNHPLPQIHRIRLHALVLPPSRQKNHRQNRNI